MCQSLTTVHLDWTHFPNQPNKEQINCKTIPAQAVLSPGGELLTQRDSAL